MREWFSGRDLAGLPGLPSTERRIRARASADKWQARERAGRGGGAEYYIGSLPDETRVALLLRERRGVAPALPPETKADAAGRDVELWAAYERKTDKAKAESTRRVNALLALEQLVREGCQRLEAYAIVAHQLGECDSTIRNWWRLVKDEPTHLWAPLLTTKYVGRRKTADYDERIYSMFRDLYLDLSRPPASVCYDRVARWAAAERVAMPHYATLCRELKRREDPAVILLEREGERALLASYPSLERSRDGLYAMQFVNSDGHVLDLDTVWPDGERARTTLLSIQDIYSSAVIGWRLVKSENAHEMRLAFLDTFDKLGIPKRLFVDNTLAAAAKQNTSGAKGRKRFRDREGDPIGVLPLLGIEVTFVTPAHGQAKPIERSFNTLANLISKHPAFSGAYLGNNTQNKPANYGERTITVAELEAVVKNEIHVYNTQLGRRSSTANGESYQHVFERSYQAHAHEIARLTANQRRLLYMVAERVTVDRRAGFIKLFNNRYYSETIARLKGTQVVVRYEPSNLHSAVWAYRLDGTLVGEAEIIHKAGFADAAAAERIKRARGQLRRTTKDQAAARRRLTAAEVAAMVPPVDAPELAAIAASSTTRIDFALPATPEQLGAKSAERRAASERVNAAIGKLADTMLEPKRKRA